LKEFIMVSPVTKATPTQPVAQTAPKTPQKPAAKQAAPPKTDSVHLSNAAQAKLQSAHAAAHKK
jgi:hypothetical protein